MVQHKPVSGWMYTHKPRTLGLGTTRHSLTSQGGTLEVLHEPGYTQAKSSHTRRTQQEM